MVCFVGVDLGTSKTGYSYCFSNEATAIKTPPQFTQADLVGAPKTDTALLFEVDASGQWVCKDWGTSAVNRYKTSQPASPDSTFRLITGKQFKLALADSHEQLPQEYKLPADCPFSAPELITTVLECIRKHAARHITMNGLDLAKTDVHYCLSVPAGWSLRAKRIMHFAAEQAGMKLTAKVPTDTAGGRDQDDDSVAGAVVLIHEQEAAALTACTDPLRDVPNLKAVPGQVWLILDAGGGTVDIAMHRIERSNIPGKSQLSEVLRALCLLQGSTRLDQRCEEALLRPLFDGTPLEYDRWKQEDPQGYINQMRLWEDVKVQFGSDTVEQPVYLQLEYSLLERLPSRRDAEDGVPGIKHGRLLITPEDMRAKVFDPVIEPILASVLKMLSVPRRSDGGTGADVLIMAGGFGSNSYLRRRIMEVCGRLLGQQPVVPFNAGRAVVLGNTIHLQQPEAIVARVSRLTYGIACGRTPSQACLSQGHVITDKHGRSVCNTHFWSLVKVDEVVRLGTHTPPFSLCPMPGNKKIKVPIYATESPEASHVTEGGMQLMGVIEVDVVKQAKQGALCWCGRMSSDDYRVELTFQFGAAEMLVQAWDLINDCKRHCTVTFDSEATASTRVILPGA